jgi:hypothetical protein
MRIKKSNGPKFLLLLKKKILTGPERVNNAEKGNSYFNLGG